MGQEGVYRAEVADPLRWPLSGGGLVLCAMIYRKLGAWVASERCGNRILGLRIASWSTVVSPQIVTPTPWAWMWPFDPTL
jgi:hypothetical protein